MTGSTRLQPNIILTGTPGTGKTTTSTLLESKLEKFRNINISDFATENELHESYDKERKSHVLDEDKLLDELEPILRKGGNIIDWHVNDIFPERLIDLVIVLRSNNGVLFDRLNKRKYHDSKIQENLDAEIMQVVLQDALDSYVKEIVIELQSDSIDDMENNVERIASWVENWKKQHPKGVTNELQFKKGSDDESESGSESEEESDN